MNIPVLDPCPFCGSKAKSRMRDYQEWTIDCQNLDCGLCDFATYDTEELAIEDWNRRAEPPTLVWSSERPKVVGKWCVRFKAQADRELRSWWVIEVDSAQLERHDWCEENGIDPHKEFEFAGPIPEPKEAAE